MHFRGGIEALRARHVECEIAAIWIGLRKQHLPISIGHRGDGEVHRFLSDLVHHRQGDLSVGGVGSTVNGSNMRFSLQDGVVGEWAAKVDTVRCVSFEIGNQFVGSDNIIRRSLQSPRLIGLIICERVCIQTGNPAIQTRLFVINRLWTSVEQCVGQENERTERCHGYRAQVEYVLKCVEQEMCWTRCRRNPSMIGMPWSLVMECTVMMLQ